MKSIPSVSSFLAAFLAAPFPAASAQSLQTFSAEPAVQFGWVLAGIGDADGDGFPDVALGDTPYLGLSPVGRVFLESGATGTILWTVDGESLGDRLGAALAPAGDLDGDGRSDLVVGAPGGDGGGGFDSGRVYVLSGASGAVVRMWDGDTPGGELGVSVAGGRDVDGDGVPDVVAGAPEADGGGLEDVGYVRVFSGASGATLLSIPGTVAGGSFGIYVALVGDVDGDGRSEFAASRFSPGSLAGEVRVFSGATGAAIYTWSGQPGEGLGFPMAAAGDVNADGTPDLIAVARGGNNSAGIVRVFSGANGAQLYAWAGPGPYAYWGSSADGAGDVDADGFDDVIVGSPTLNGFTGMARVFSGATGGILFTWSSAVVGGVSAVGGAGDLDQDGRDDVLVGNGAAGLGYPQPGQVVARSGLTGGVMFTWAGTPSSLRFGHAVDGVGDLDADGVADVVVGGHGPDINGGGGGTGTARAFSGATGALLLSWSGTLGSEFGRAVAGCGDLDSDGVPDIAVGAPPFGSPTPPEVTVFSGADGSVLRNWVDLPWTRFGAAVAGAGDVDGDGTPDLAAGAPYAGLPFGGEVRIYSGSTGAVLRVILGSPGSFGSAMALAGDVNDDSLPDLLVGDPYNGAGGPGAGQARVFSGANGAILLSWNGPGLQAAFGTSVAGGGDVDGDGRPDLAVGAPGASSSMSGGQAFAFSGATGTPIFVLSGITVGEGFGYSLAVDGDANGDGWADLAVGVPNASGGGGTTGAVRIFAGPVGILVDTLEPGPAEDAFGSSVAFVGRVDVGACDDLVIGAPYTGISGNGMASIRASAVGGPFGITDLGNSLAGTGGLAPELRGLGLLQVGATVTLAVRRALGGTVGALALGATVANAPAFQGILVPFPDVLVPGLAVSGAGESSLSFLIPSPLPPGTTFFVQELFLDAGAPQSVSFSNALAVTSP